MMSKYYIENVGCDDITKLVIDLTDKELEIFIKICKELNKNSAYRCQPEIEIYKYDECEIEKDEDREYIYKFEAENLIKEDKQ